jgi:hypothetical protein
VIGRPSGADLPMAAPGKRSEVKAGRRPPPEAARAERSGLEGASRPVFCWQVGAEGSLGNEAVSEANAFRDRRFGLSTGAGASYRKSYRYFTYR